MIDPTIRDELDDALGGMITRQATSERAEKIEQACASFGVNLCVVDTHSGPTVSVFEVDLSDGLRVGKLSAIQTDLAIELRVPSVRVIESTPDTHRPAIEIPNEDRTDVGLSDFGETHGTLPLLLGLDSCGKPIIPDLAKLPHLLVAGRTGTGKSVCLNSIICSLLMAKADVKLLLVDPKQVEFIAYDQLPCLRAPVVTDMRIAADTLARTCAVMHKRYSILKEHRKRSIDEYNRATTAKPMSRLVIVVDELADLMLTSIESEEHLVRLAAKGRAVGIHLVLATQKPTVDIITGLIKSNMPARLAFQVASMVDSRVILDCNGAERLLGRGDFLFSCPRTLRLIRGQGTFVSDEEIHSLTTQR